MTETTVVLAWDGLDPTRVESFGMSDDFGSSTTRVETIVNAELDKPHTYELWPSIITGRPPSAHGIHAHEYIEEGWDSRLLTMAARYSHLVPEEIRWRAGRLIRDHGAEYAFEGPDYYHDQGIETLFDRRHSVPIAIPNYRSPVDDGLGISMDRGAALSEYLDVETAADGSTIHRPAVSIDQLSMRLEAEAGEKVAAAANALGSDPDIVFVWLGYLDTVGHVAPTVSDSREWYRYHYANAVQWTEFVRDRLDESDRLVCVSDHGLEDGAHTEEAFLGADGVDISDVSHVLDVFDPLDQITPRTAAPASQFQPAGEKARHDVESELEALGYL